MSISVMAQVWKEATVSGSELLVLLALADYSDDDGGSIFPSVATIAKKARLSTAQARRVVHKLTDAGILELIAPGGWRHGRNWPNEYRIIVTAIATPLQDAGTNADATPLHPREYPPSMDASTVLAPVQDDPSLEPPEEKDAPLPAPREAPAEKRVALAAEIGVSPKQLTALTNTLLDLTGGRVLADAGDDYKLRDAQDAAIILAQIGYGSVDALKELADAWKKANEWRGTMPSIRNLKDHAGQRAASVNGSSAAPSWGALNQDVPDYMRG